MALTFAARTGSGASAEDFADFEDGVYEIELKTVDSVPNKFYEPATFDSTGKETKKASGTPEQWCFRFLVPDVVGLEVRFWSNQVMGEKTAAQHIIGCLMGRPLAEGDSFTLEDLAGKRCKCMLTLNPDTGFPRIKGMAAFIMPRGKAAPVAAVAAPSRPLPPPPLRKAAPTLRDQAQLDRLIAAGTAAEIDQAGLNDWAVKSYGHGLDALTPEQCEELIAALGGAPF